MSSITGYLVQLQQGPGGAAKQVRAGFIVDATGHRARFARTTGSEKSQDDQLFATVRFARVANARGSRRVQLEATPYGWCYHALLPDRRVVNMFVTDKEPVAALRDQDYAGFERAVGATTLVAESLAKLVLQDARYQVAPIHSGVLSTVEGDDWMAIGDAAASFDPIAARGIYKGLDHGLRAGIKVGAWFRNEGTYRSDFTEQVHSQYEDYWRNRTHLYALERRWPDSKFWHNRLKSGVPDGLST